MEVLLQQHRLAHALVGGVGERVLDHVAQLVERARRCLGVLEERHAAEDDLRRRRPSSPSSAETVATTMKTPSAESVAPVAQGDVVGVADVDAVDEDHPGVDVLAEAGALGVDLERAAPLRPRKMFSAVDPDRLGELGVQAHPLVVAVERATRSAAWSG